MTAAARLAAPTRPGNWSIAALVLAGAGVIAATWLVVATDTDPGGVLWPFVVAPIAIALAPIASFWSISKKSVKIGTRKTPPPKPSMEPTIAAAAETTPSSMNRVISNRFILRTHPYLGAAAL